MKPQWEGFQSVLLVDVSASLGVALLMPPLSSTAGALFHGLDCKLKPLGLLSRCGCLGECSPFSIHVSTSRYSGLISLGGSILVVSKLKNATSSVGCGQ